MLRSHVELQKNTGYVEGLDRGTEVKTIRHLQDYVRKVTSAGQKLSVLLE